MPSQIYQINHDQLLTLAARIASEQIGGGTVNRHESTIEVGSGIYITLVADYLPNFDPMSTEEQEHYQRKFLVGIETGSCSVDELRTPNYKRNYK